MNGSSSDSELSLMGTPNDTPLSASFTLAPGHSEPQSADTFLLKLNTSLCVAETYREHFLHHVSDENTSDCKTLLFLQ